jgi:hypothetical protein
MVYKWANTIIEKKPEIQLMFGYIEALLTFESLRIYNIIDQWQINLIALIGLVI